MNEKRLRDWWKDLSIPKKFLAVILLLAPPVLAWSCYLWIVSMHGGLGFFRVMGNFRKTFFVFGFAWIAISFLLIAIMVLKFRPFVMSKKYLGRSLSVILVLLLIMGIAGPITFYVVIEAYRIARSGDKAPQLLVADGHGSTGIPNMAVCFWTDNPTRNTVAWGKKGSTGATIREEKPGSQHAFNLVDLTPATHYWYRINDGKQYSFVSPPASGAIRFAAVGDAHFGSRNPDASPQSALKILDTVTRNPGEYAMFIGLGDMADHGFRDITWKRLFDSFSPYSTKIPFRPFAGNHDTLMDNAHHYQEYMYPDPMKLQSGTKLYYRVDVGPVHFFMLDLEWGTDTFSSAQRKWLESELSKVPAGDWKIVMSHCFYYSSGSMEYGWPWYDDKQTIDAITPIIKKYDVDLVIGGHNHHMELLQKDGIPYLVVGSFGGVPDPEPLYVSPASLWRKFGQYGFLDVTVDGSKASMNFRDPEGQVLKSAVCEKGKGLVEPEP